MVVITVVALISGLVFYRISRMRQAVKKLKNLKKEEESVQKLIKDVQRKYFKDGIISKLDYEITSKRYGERLANIRKDILLMQKIKKGQENIQKQKI
jgi:type II secretory pathway pseudopilin PulG